MDKYKELFDRLTALLDSNPAEAVKQVKEIDLPRPIDEFYNLQVVRAAILVDGGALTQQQDAIEDGITLFRELYNKFPTAFLAYNLANGLAAAIGSPPRDDSWLDHMESSRERRAEARKYYWEVTQDKNADVKLQTQAWTNLANLFSSSRRFGEAQDGWHAALVIDPKNGVAASSAARNLQWLCTCGGGSDLTCVEIRMLAQIANQNRDRVTKYVGSTVAEKIVAFTSTLQGPPSRLKPKDPFIRWVEDERLALAPTIGLIDPTMDKLDWLMLSAIREREPKEGGTPPPIFAMFNTLKSDYILARDLLWRAMDENIWPRTGRFGDTLDYAAYGPDISALILAHRTALDLLDKIAVAANYHFELGQSSNNVCFGKLWRKKLGKTPDRYPLAERVEKVIREGTSALYGLVELADDYASQSGILHSQKDIRNAGTHRFVVLHDVDDLTQSRRSLAIKHFRRESFIYEVLCVLRIARSAIQMLAFSISQYEQILIQKTSVRVVPLIVPDYD
ncbi:LA2681 family HEPN domain-containing protein [Sutterella wadsworthensis]|uniref:LA2681 family HEPN domain-containing protein n=1 Tax=Sutterella wadsworthensis TaxID=40545 RepID=UPI001D06C074|nr:LA2681 family HEPN domain-containing protein [Sutterella wadsworthensis]MCB7457137.1 hypothetical protein [Sutterella wadsworthensis]